MSAAQAGFGSGGDELAPPGSLPSSSKSIGFQPVSSDKLASVFAQGQHKPQEAVNAQHEAGEAEGGRGAREEVRSLCAQHLL